MVDSVIAYLDEHANDAQALLERLCRQPSVVAQGLGMPQMADLIEGLLSETGFKTERLFAEGSPPAIYGELRGRSPYTILLYNHYDVQPAEPLELWHSPPFEPTIRDGKFYARGACDNKGEIASRLTAIRALRTVLGELPITLRWIIEGEEEIGSPHFGAIASKYAPLLQADGCFWEGEGFGPTGRPELLLGTKGLLYVQLDVQGTGIDAHSGSAPILPSAAWRLVQALATLRTPEAHVRIPGFYNAVLKPSEAQLAAIADQPNMDAELREAYKVDQFVDGLSGAALGERLAFTPTCNLAGLVSGYTGQGSKTVLPAQASAKFSFRLVGKQDPERIRESFRDFVRARLPPDCRAQFISHGASAALALPFGSEALRRARRALHAEWDKEPVLIGSGGSIPIVGIFKRDLKMDALMIGFGLDDDRIHSPNEKYELTSFHKGARSWARILAALAA